MYLQVRRALLEVLNKPLVLIVFTAWIIFVAAELGYLEEHPLELIKTDNKFANKAIKFLQTYKESLSLALGALGVYLMNPNQDSMVINIGLCLYAFAFKSHSIWFFTVLIIFDFIYFALRDPKEKFFVLCAVIGFLMINNDGKAVVKANNNVTVSA